MQLLTTNFILKTFFPGITELVNNIQHSVREIQHFCVLKDDGFTTLSLFSILFYSSQHYLTYLEKQIHLVNMLETVLRSENHSY